MSILISIYTKGKKWLQYNKSFSKINFYISFQMTKGSQTKDMNENKTQQLQSFKYHFV